MINLILNCILAVVFLMVLCCKIDEKKITFISYKSDKLEKDFKLIANELNKRDKYKQKYILHKYEKSIKGNFKYLLNCIVQLYYINTSAIVILDYNNYVVSNFKRSGVKVVQIWHASGAIKKFGNDTNRRYKIRNYDYVISSSDIWKPHYSTAFNISEEKVISLGIPSTDYLFNSNKVKRYKEALLEKYPSLRGKKIILFAPTFRGDHIKNATFEKIDLDMIKTELGDEYVIIYKLHPWIGDKVISRNSGIINCNSENISKLLSAADYLITDYSSIVFEYSILERPIILYTPDLNKYKETPGMYLEYNKDIKLPICKTESELINIIKGNKINRDDIIQLKDSYFKYKDGFSTKRVAEFLELLGEYNE